MCINHAGTAVTIARARRHHQTTDGHWRLASHVANTSNVLFFAPVPWRLLLDTVEEPALPFVRITFCHLMRTFWPFDAV